MKELIPSDKNLHFWNFLVFENGIEKLKDSFFDFDAEIWEYLPIGSSNSYDELNEVIYCEDVDISRWGNEMIDYWIDRLPNDIVSGVNLEYRFIDAFKTKLEKAIILYKEAITSQILSIPSTKQRKEYIEKVELTKIELYESYFKQMNLKNIDFIILKALNEIKGFLLETIFKIEDNRIATQSFKINTTFNLFELTCIFR